MFPRIPNVIMHETSHPTDPFKDRRRSRSPRDRESHYSRDRGYSRDREGERDYRDHRDHRDHYRDNRGFYDRQDKDRRGSDSRDHGTRRSRSPGGYGRGYHRRRRSPSPPADEATCDRRTVFVMQLSARLRASELEEFFSTAGKVRAARIIEDRNTGRSKGVGYVEFYDEDSVAKAIELTGQKLLGIPVIAKHTESEKNRLAAQSSLASQEAIPAATVQQPAPDNAQHRLFVGSVNFDLTEDDLKKEFEPFGPIEFVKIHRDAETGKSKGFAFIQYKNAEDAKQAVWNRNGYTLAGRAIKVWFASEKGTQPQHINYQNGGHINNSISIDESAGYAMTSQSRADLMQKLARGDASLGAVPPTPSAPASVSAPVPQTVVKNELEWAKELEEDVKEEAEKCGPVVHIHVEQDSVGEIYLKFDSVQSATRAYQSLGGRFFAGRQIIAAYLPEMLYNVRFPRAATL
ncbi:hypothetical protein BGW38_000960 [Lunasporangiospora selenospora]|uniref:RRM domain-containing protein n=1 Tax=Lunasporangiospora selenospora TaxID=979761 RepID=A0A9P6FUY2_9FUNG|nr:hypothetical protein BGW38_000960 [Lunasporangiospora selenospora]